jgi:trans-2,3-dihydro-3-hydroxyanthranilate isomerase
VRDYAILDVFTSVPLQGNQLAVFTDAAGLAADVMQRTARELNLSETVFIFAGDGEADARIRIFTPGAELPFAGHPVLGTAFVVGEQLDREQLRLRTAAGIVPVELTRGDGGREAFVFGEMQQPIPTVGPFERPDELLAALGVARAELPIEAYVNGPRHVMVALREGAEVAALKPDLAALEALGEVGVSCFAVSGDRVKTRMFAPALGVHEDPATGSAAGPLALHLARHGRIAFGQGVELSQGVEIGRPSVLHARVDGGPDRIERIVVGGAAVRVATGQYLLD